MSKIVTFEQAKRLKKLYLFNDTLHYYDINGTLNEGFHVDVEDKVRVSDILFNYNTCMMPHVGKAISAPTLSEALDWIREEKGIACGVGLNANSDNRFLGNYIYEYVIDNNRVEGCSGFDTHPLAENALLDAVLTYLEETNNNIDQQS